MSESERDLKRETMRSKREGDGDLEREREGVMERTRESMRQRVLREREI